MTEIFEMVITIGAVLGALAVGIVLALLDRRKPA